MENWEQIQLMLDDEEIVFAVLEHHLNAIAAIIDLDAREFAPWVKIRVNVEDWRTLEDPTFRTHFRMSRPVFDRLCTAVQNHLILQNRLHRIRTPIDLCLMMALWILMNMDTFKNTALHFGVSPGVVLFHYIYLIEALREMSPQYIQWPSQEERNVIKAAYLARGGYPGVVGIIDGMHAFVTAPLIEKPAYVNRHHFYSVLTQAVVDDQLLVRDLYTGEPGSLHDSRMYRRSPLSTNLLERPELLAPDEHILGDGGYILTDKLLIPYDDNGALTEAQTYHNTKLSSIRSDVERGFCFVKMRFPRLKYFRSICMEYAVDHIVSCFVLHNFIILNGDEAPQFEVPNGAGGGPNDEDDVEEVDDPDRNEEFDRGYGDFPNVNVEPDHPLQLEAHVLGEEKREALCARLWEERDIHEQE